MENTILVVVLWILIPVVIGGIILWSMHREKKRKQALEQAANDLGLAFSPQLSQVDDSAFSAFPLAQIGHGRKASSAVVADSGELRMVIFDYVYTTGSGKNKSTHRQSVVLASSASLQLPEFTLAPEHFFHRIADIFGFKDIDFEDDKDFSDRFLLKGPNEQAVRELFARERREAFKKLQHISVQGRGNSFIFYQVGLRRDAEHLRALMEEGFTVYGALSTQQPS